MRVKGIGRGLYEVWDNPDSVPYTVYVLGEQSCSCPLYQERLNGPALENKRLACPHLDAAAQDYNLEVQRARAAGIRYPEMDAGLEVAQMKQRFDSAQDDLQHMLAEMTEQETDT
jgi:hypothetical protein